MNEELLAEKLDLAIDQILAHASMPAPTGNEDVYQLAEIAEELHLLPTPRFRAQLKADLMERAWGKARIVILPKPASILPTLFGEGYGNYTVRQRNFAASVALHFAIAGIVLGASIWMAQRTARQGLHETVTLVAPADYALPVAPTQSAGGGGGGDRDLMSASTGRLPKFAMEQIAPPAIVVRNDTPKLAAEPTVVGAPLLTMPSEQLGDPLSAVLGPASNGTGSGGGIGTGNGGGIGTGSGPGVGGGRGGGTGGGIFRVGGGVSAPRPIYDPDPEFSEEARAAKYQGKVLLWVVIGADGRPQQMRVQRSLGMGLDERALAAVKTWRFEPAMKDGHPVAVQVNIEVNFRLY